MKSKNLELADIMVTTFFVIIMLLMISITAAMVAETYIKLKNAGVQKSSLDARIQLGTKR